jgi:polar amino acid transport system permease protein
VSLTELDFAVVWEYGPSLLRGLLVNLALTALGFLAGGVVLGTLLALAGLSHRRWVRWPAFVFVEFWRSTPLLVQAIWVHFALPAFTGFSTSAFGSALLALVFNVSAYCGEIIRAGIKGVPKGQFEAAKALALPRRVTWQKVVLPQALRLVVPPLVSSVISIFKATAILSVLSIDDLTRVAQRVSAYTYQPIEVYTAAAALYFLCGSVVAWAGARVERSFAAAGAR